MDASLDVIWVEKAATFVKQELYIPSKLSILKFLQAVFKSLGKQILNYDGV